MELMAHIRNGSTGVWFRFFPSLFVGGEGLELEGLARCAWLHFATLAVNETPRALSLPED